MAKLRVFPHRQIGPSAIEFEGWHVRVGQAPQMPVARHLPNFDYSSEMQFGFRARLHLDQIRSSAGIDDQSTLAFYLLVDCESSNVRFKEVLTVSEGEEFECWLTVPPGQLAAKVKLERGLVLDELGSSNVWDSPKRRGALLFSDDPCSVQLEGDAPRFPTQAIDFAAEGLPKNAAWKLRISYDDPNQPFNSAVRLLINTRHPAHNVLLAAERNDIFDSALHSDIARQLIATLSRDEQFLAQQEWRDESLGAVVDRLCRHRLPYASAAQAIQRFRQDPTRFDAHIQNAFGYLGSNK